MESTFQRLLSQFPDRHNDIDRQVQDQIAHVRDLGQSVENQHKQIAERQLQLFSQHPVAGTSWTTLRARVEQAFDSKMMYIYGFSLPQTLNEWEAAKTLSFVGYPYPLYMTPVRFCDEFLKQLKDLTKVVESIDPNFYPHKESSKSICDRSDWPAEWYKLKAVK